MTIRDCLARGRDGEPGSFIYNPLPPPPDPPEALEALEALEAPPERDPNDDDPNLPADPNTGANGLPGEPGAEGAAGAEGLVGADGYNGGRGGHGYGGAFYFEGDSTPRILHCTIIDCQALGGHGGDGGEGQAGGAGQAGQQGQNGQDGQEGGPGIDDGPQGAGGAGGAGGNGGAGGSGGAGGRGGDGGDGGEALGGAIYFGPDCRPTIEHTSILNCLTRQGIGADANDGGAGGAGGDGGLPGEGGAGGGGEPEGEAGAAGLEGVAGNGGPGGAGGNMGKNGARSWGGGIFFDDGCQAVISDTVVGANSAMSSVATLAYIGGSGGNGGDGGTPGGIGGNAGSGGAGDPAGSAGSAGGGGDGGGPGEDGSGGSTDTSITTNFGGGLAYNPNCTVKLSNCTIQSNFVEAENGGGEHYSEGCTSELVRCNVSGNMAGLHGGGQSFDPSCSITVTESAYLGNVAAGDGGGLYCWYNCDLDVNATTFADNQATNAAQGDDSCGGGLYGGGVWDDQRKVWYNGGSVNVRNSAFLNNAAVFGGGLYWYGDKADVSIVNCVMRDNAAEHGGGLYWSGGAPTIRDCSIKDNTATGPLYTVFVPAPPMDPNDPNTWPDSSLWPDPNDPNSLFDPNNPFTPPPVPEDRETDCGSGGGLICWGADAIIENCIVGGNTSQGTGGGVYFGGDSFPILKNCLVKDNSALIDGGGIVSYWEAVPTITNCTIVDNDAFDANEPNRGKGGGLSCSYESKTTLINSIVWNNTGQEGEQIAIGSESDVVYYQRPATLTVEYSNVQGGQAGVHVEPGRILNWSTTNIEEDPLFVASYYLSQVAAGQDANSPCVDTGSAPANIVGLDRYTTRTDNVPDAGIVDMGFHYPGAGRYQLTVTVIGPGAVEPLGGFYHEFSEVTLVAAPEPGYRVRQWIGTDNDPSWNKNTNTVTMDTGDKFVTVEFEEDKTRSIFVPEEIPTIEEAISVAGPGGTRIVVSPGVHRIANPGGIDFQGKILTLTSTDPSDPAVVAKTIIDCNGTETSLARAFHFRRGEDANSVVAGFTIRNGFIIGLFGQNAPMGTSDPLEFPPPIDDNLPPLAPRAQSATGEGYGGGILCENGSSPTIRDCVITNCVVIGARGGDGAPGQSGSWSWVDAGGQTQNSTDGQWGGYGGAAVGTAYGGGIACRQGSSPAIINCTIQYNVAMGALGGNGGDGGNAGGGRESGGGSGGAAIGAALGGGCYADSSSAPTLTDCRFVNNVTLSGVGGSGGAPGIGNALPIPPYFVSGFDGTAYALAEVRGGAVAYDDGSQAQITGCDFSSNKAWQQRSTSGYAATGEGRFVSYSLDSMGGALYCGLSCATSLKDCSFTENYGAAVAIAGGGVLDVNNCRFDRNEFVSFREPNELQFFDQYESLGIGSDYPHDWAWTYFERLRPQLLDADMAAIMASMLSGVPVSPEAEWHPIGGALYVGPACRSVDITDTQFHGNISAVEGGAMWLESDANLVDCTFGMNAAANNGGALRAYHDTGDPNAPLLLNLTMDRCVFLDNEAAKRIRREDLGGLIGLPYFTFAGSETRRPGETDIAGLGGGAYFNQVNATVRECHFLRNQAKNGGAVVAVGGRLDLTGGSIHGNRATGASGIDTSGFDMIGRFLVSRRVDLSAGRDIGGGIVCVTSDAVIQNAVLSENVADGIAGRGGALCFFGTGDEQVVKNCLFADNTASWAGGAVSCEIYAEPNLVNCTFVQNTAEKFAGGVFCDWSANVAVFDSIFQKCGPYAIGEESFGGATVLRSLFHANSDGDYGVHDTETQEVTATDVTDLDASNATGDPLFVTGPFGAYYLSQIASGQDNDSPGLDAGGPSAEEAALAALTTRTDGTGDGGAVDLGFHYPDPNGVPQYTLTTRVADGLGRIEPATGTFYAGTVVRLTAVPDKAWRVQKWEGTGNDVAGEETFIVMTGDRDVAIWFDQPRVLNAQHYQSIQHAIDDAQDGDVVIVPTGTHTTESWYSGPELWIIDKGITLAGPNPDDLEAAEAAIIKNYNLYITSSDVIIEGLTFTGHGKIRVLSSAPTIRNCRFVNCWVYGWNGTNVTQINDDGTNGNSAQGGALEIMNGAPRVVNCLFSGCWVAGGDGGPGDNEGTPPGIAHDGGWAGYAYGGAVYAGFDSSPVFEDCRFENCYAEGGNGGPGGNSAIGGRGGNWEWSRDSVESGPLTVPYWDWWDGWDYGQYGADGRPDYGSGPGFPTMFREYWKYSGYGGAVYCENETSAQFIRCTFENNRTLGGLSGEPGIGNASPQYDIPNRRLQLPNFGGSVYACNGTVLEFVDCAISGSVADPNVDPNTVPDANDFFGYSGPHDVYVSYGGGVAVETDCKVRFVNSTVEECEATVGGGLYLIDSELEIVDSNLADNRAYHGGAVYSAETTGSIDKSMLSRNIAAYEHPGVTVTPDPNDPNFVIFVSPFDAGAIFGQGGACYLLSAPLTVSDSVLTDNEASASGGAIYYGGARLEEVFTPHLHNSLLTGNRSGRDGGAVSVNWYAEPTITNCTITDNKVMGAVGDGAGFGGGLYVSYNSHATVSDSIIWANTGVEGAQVAVGTGFEHEPRRSSLTISHSDIGPRFDPNQLGTIEMIAAAQIQPPPPPVPEPNDANDVLTDRAEIYRGFSEGQDKVKVIVTLVPPVRVDWQDPESVSRFRAAAAERRDSVMAALGPGDFIPRQSYENMAGFSGEVSRMALETLAKHPLVRHIEPVRYVTPMLRQAQSLGNSKEIRHIYNGQGVAIAIIDSGVDYRHPMLGGGGFPNAKVIGGYDTGNDDPDPMPVEPHGTSCSGIAAGDLATVEDYIGGVAYRSKIYALKLSSDTGFWPTDSAVRAWDWCVTHRDDDPRYPLKVMSNSWGMYFYPFNNAMMADAFSPALTAMANAATSVGITILGASGNDGYAGQGISWPSAMSNVISVGALYDATSVVTEYSNTAMLLDVLAPADPVYTTDIVGAFGYTPGDYFPSFGGTSSACPFAAGCVASVQSAAMERIGRFLTPAEVKQLLIQTGDPVTDIKVPITKPRVNLGVAAMSPYGQPIYVGKSCLLNGWEAPDSDNYNGWDPALWGADANVIEADPLFISGYFLSQIAAGQTLDSPAVDAGSVDANDPVRGFDPNAYTTRIDAIGDVNVVDMGYHYPISAMSELTVTVVDDKGRPLTDPNLIHGFVDPNHGVYTDGDVVELIAYPDPNYRVAEWTGTDDDDSTDPNNTVTMAGDRYVTVRFETKPKHKLIVNVIGPGRVDPNQGEYYEREVIDLIAYPEDSYRVREWTGADNTPAWNVSTNTVTIGTIDTVVTVVFEKDVTRNIIVPTEFDTIEQAVAAASPGDTNIILRQGVHPVMNPEGIDVRGKLVRIMSVDPNDPDVVANTIIDCAGSRMLPKRAFWFHSGETQDCIVTGVTIRNAYWIGEVGLTGGGPLFIIDVNDQNTGYIMPAGLPATGLGYGGAILCEEGSSPTISKCVIENCTVVGAQGGDGISGFMVFQDLNGSWGGDGGDGTGTGFGGAIACLGESKPRVVKCTIRNCTARGGMGGNGGNGSERFDGGGDESWGGDGGNAFGDGRGGAVYCENGSDAVFEECVFANNAATMGVVGQGGRRGGGGNLDPRAQNGMPGSSLSDGMVVGGAVYQNQASPTFVDCRFIDNRAYESYDYSYFSGLYVEDLETEVIPIQARGGAIYAGMGTAVAPERCVFRGNSSSAIYVEGASVIDCNGCSFSKNEANDENAALAIYLMPIIIIGDDPNDFQIIDVNRPPLDYSGGAMYVGPNCPDVNLYHCQFYSNMASVAGGAVRLMSDANIVGCAFSGNKAGEDGGAIDAYLDTGDPNDPAILRLNLESSSFGGNKAVDGMYGLGGAVHFRDFEATLRDCYFMGNEGKNGGGLFLSAGRLTLTGGSISDNTAIGGSGIDTRVDIDESILGDLYDIFGISSVVDIYYGLGTGLAPGTGPAVDVGGGLVCAAAHATIEHCTFNNNTAEGLRGAGGAISFYGGYVDHFVKNCLFAGNAANREGGAIACGLFATPTVASSTFAHNTAGRLGGAIFCDWDSDVTVRDSIFAANADHAIAEQDFANSIVEHTLFYENPDGDFGVYDIETDETLTLSGADLDLTNLVEDPLFVNGPLGGFYLSQIPAGQTETSPAVDAGSSLVADATLAELTTRSDGVADSDEVDLGFHYGDHTTMPKYTLTAEVLRGRGTISPEHGEFYPGTVVPVVATPDPGWRIDQWSGTTDDASWETDNFVVMGPDRHVTVEFDQPRTIYVGSDPNYTTIQHAIDQAEEGDVVVVLPGTYQPAAWNEYPWNYIRIQDKNITLTGTNPDDPNVVASTFLRRYVFEIDNVGPQTVIEGLTIGDVNWVGADGFDGPDINIDPDGQHDGAPGSSMFGGAMTVYNASPIIRNCVFRDCSITGGDGGAGSDGHDGHAIGYDGGWAGYAYGGAVYCGYRSSPTFENCAFTNCRAYGGNGGDGGNGQQASQGGRGGNWMLSDAIEQTIRLWWDGWEWGQFDQDGNLRPYIGGTLGQATRGYFDDYWKYSGYGGAVYCEFYSSPRFVDCNFTDNHTFGGVCGIGGTTDPIPALNLDIENFGGAVYIRSGSDPEFVGCIFRDNSADANAADEPDDLYISYGGSVAFEDECSPVFIGCTIEDSNAAIGGGMWWSRSSPTITDCNIAGNMAYHGGGLYSVDSNGVMSNTIVQRNLAFFSNIDPNLLGDPNVAFAGVLSTGGGYACINSPMEIHDSIFVGNRALSSGGGLYIAGSDQDVNVAPLLHNSLIVGNTAGRDGGGLSTWWAEPILSNCTIADNVVAGPEGAAFGGGLYIGYSSNAWMRDSIVWRNTSTHVGSQIAVAHGYKYGPRPSTLRVSYSDVESTTDPNAGRDRALDLVFVLDSTDSMMDSIDAIQLAAQEIVAAVDSVREDYRLAVVDFKDFNDALGIGIAGDYPFRVVTPFTEDLARIVSGINSLTTPGGSGGDVPESAYYALMQTIDGNDLDGWRTGDVDRVILMVGDDPPHDPEPPTGYIAADVVQAALETPSKRIFTVQVGDDPVSSIYFGSLAGGAGGALLRAADANEVVETVLDSIDMITGVAPPIYVSDGSKLPGWDAVASAWAPDTNNIDADPLFIAGYYLTQTQTDRSPAVDAGSGSASSVGLSDRTTHTEGIPDAGIVDLGYHYAEGVTLYELTTAVVPDPNDGLPHGTLSPTSAQVYGGSADNVIQLEAEPDEGWKVKEWKNTDDDTSTDTENTVTLTEDRHVTVMFEKRRPRVVTVPGDQSTIQGAVTVAEDGDTIVVDPGTYYSQYQGIALVVDKAVTITSRNPDDPCMVAATVLRGPANIEGNTFNSLGVIFTGDADGRSVLNGFTIENFGGFADDGDAGNRDDGHPNGYDGNPIHGAAMIILTGASPVVKNCVIRSNQAIAGDGGDGVDATDTYNAGRGGWGGWARGGAIYCAKGTNPTFINCIIEDNLAQGGNGGNGGNWVDGGGLANYGGNYTPPLPVDINPDRLGGEVVDQPLWEIWQWDFAMALEAAFGGETSIAATEVPIGGGPYAGDYRWYSGYGGGVFVDEQSMATFVECTIRGNRTYGGMSGQGGTGAGDRNTEPLIPFEIPSYGGGVYIAADSMATFKSCTFEDNMTSPTVAGQDPNFRLDPYMGYGGGVAAERTARLDFNDCNFVGNMADTGGGLYIADASAMIIDCNLITNVSLRGGGFAGTGGTVDIVGCNVKNNLADTDVNDPNDDGILALGAGIACWSMDAWVQDCNITGNDSGGSGGGIYLRGENSSYIFNCLVRDNSASRDGGGLSTNWYATPTIRNCTFVSNAAPGTAGDPTRTGLGGAIFCGYMSDCTVLDTILWENLATDGSELAVGSGFTLDPMCGTLTVGYSNFLTGPNDVWVDDGCSLIEVMVKEDDEERTTNLSRDPMFVDGPLGRFYLSNRGAGQARTSPCVDAGSAQASRVGLSRYTTRTDLEPDVGWVDIGFHYRLLQPCKYCDLLFDGVIDFRDLEVLVRRWLEEDCSERNGWCGGADVTFDSRVDIRDYAVFADCWLAEDDTPPVPDPAEWDENGEPRLIDNVAEMTAAEAFDTWGWDVEYYFQCYSGDCHDSGWQSSREYVDTGLTPGLEYGYRVKARDTRPPTDPGDPNYASNETEWSTLRFAGARDTTPPRPSPRILTIDPNSSQSITMTASEASDENGVQYQFQVDDVNTPGGHDSVWLDVPIYTDVDLDPDTLYCYRVRARDLSGNLNTTNWSEWECIRTQVPPDLTPPDPNPAEFDPNGLPREFQSVASDPFGYSVEMAAVLATDAGGGLVEYFFECLDRPAEAPEGFSSGWIPNNTWTVLVGRQNQGLRFRVRTRDQYGNKSEWSTVEMGIKRPNQPPLTPAGGVGGGGPVGGGGAIVVP